MHRPFHFSHRLGLGLLALLVVLGTLTTSLLLAQHSSFMQLFTPTVAFASSTSGSISAGNDHSLTLKPDGTVWAWGNNVEGALGDGTTTDRHSPVQVLAGACSSCGTYLTGITAVSAGSGCICQ
jgi:alpha-tubulin suppressor-like RCC1 family protein